MRIRNSLLVLSIAAFSASVNAQRELFVRHNQLVDSAKTLLAKGHPAEALQYFEQGIELIPWDTKDYWPAIKAAIKLDAQDLALRLMLKGTGYGLSVDLGDDSIMDVFLNSPYAATYHEQRPDLRVAYLATVDTALIHEVMDLFEADQAVRVESIPIEEMVRQDSIHFDHMIAICRRYGTYPQRLLGATSGYWFLPLWHHRGADEYPHTRQWKEILPYILEAISSGNLDPAYLCGFDDIEDIDLDRPLRWAKELDLGKRDHSPRLIDRDKLNANRASVGWGTIEDFALQEGWDLNKMTRE